MACLRFELTDLGVSPLLSRTVPYLMNSTTVKCRSNHLHHVWNSLNKISKDATMAKVKYKLILYNCIFSLHITVLAFTLEPWILKGSGNEKFMKCHYLSQHSTCIGRWKRLTKTAESKTVRNLSWWIHVLGHLCKLQLLHSMMSWNLTSKKSSTPTEYGVWKLLSCSFTNQSKKNPFP